MPVTTAWTPIGRSAMHHRHVDLRAVMVQRDDWERPARYTSAEEELGRLENAVGLFDMSPVGKLNIQGYAIDEAITRILESSEALEVGAVRTAETEGGAVRAARLARDEAMIVTEPNQASAVVETFGLGSDECAHIVDVTSGLAAIRIVGPSARLLLEAVTELDTSAEALPNSGCAQGAFLEVHGILLRLDLGGLPAYEIYTGREFGEYAWDALLETGAEYGVVPVGVEAMEELAGSVHRGARGARGDG